MISSLWTAISPVALGITPRDLVVLSPADQAQRIRQAADAMKSIAEKLEQKIPAK